MNDGVHATVRIRAARPSGGVKSAERTVDLLELLAAHPGGLRLADIAAELDLAKSSTHAIVATLVGRQVLRVTQDERGTVYQLGHRIFEIGQAYALTTDLIADGQRAVRNLSDACGETVHLAGLDGNFVVYLAKHEGSNPVRMVSAVGKRLPAHGTGVGKVLLAGLTDIEVERRFGAAGALPRLTGRTVGTVSHLLADLDEVRIEGVATEREESTEGVGCVAAPVYDASGLVAAISIAVPIGRFPPVRAAQLAEQARTAAEALSIRLGAGQSPARIIPGVTHDV
jgi:DNA-binding IclR family transcriptional regulator